jgi:HlyD family secretion protein
MNRLLPILAIVAVIFTASYLVRTRPHREKTEPPSPPPATQYEDTVAAVGLIEASTENIALGAHLPGVVEKVFVKAGDQVTAGQPLFTQETDHLSATLGVRQAALLTAQAHLVTAQANLADAQDQLNRSQRLGKERVISTDELMRRQFAVQTGDAKVGEARAEIASAQAQITETETEITRSTVRAPIDADVLQVKIRAGEFAPTGQTSEALITLGGLRPLHVRVDVDEHEASRVRGTSAAVAHIRGNASLKTPLKFIRFEPLVVPKRSLTGASTERVDTRVLQVIYAIDDDHLPLYVGQQMDVFIEDKPIAEKTAAR